MSIQPDEQAENDLARRDNYCEDYPCCGHTEQDPCRREWYDDPVQMHAYVSKHLYCDHEAGIYDCEGYGDDDDDE